MATTIASQLKALRAFIHDESEPSKRPFTRPSVIFNPKEAADIDVETIHSIALSGLEALSEKDNRFERFKGTLFCNKSRELDRELMGLEENNRINSSISSYLRLLSGYMQLPSSLKTLEYLIRLYKVHVYNIDDMILCALPYHDTHAFVRIVQLIHFGNTKWGFLEGVKVSGAPPPRAFIVQQCMRDMGVLEVICTYASPTKKFRHSSQVVAFCTAVIVEFVGAKPVLETNTLSVILPFVLRGLQPEMKGGSDLKASALMIIGLLASRTTLASKLIERFIMLISRAAVHDVKACSDLPWLQLSLMSIINLVQTQSVLELPKKCLEVLCELRDFAGALLALSRKFDVKKFLSVYLKTLIKYSYYDHSFLVVLVTALDIIPVKNFIDNIVTEVLSSCPKASLIKETSLSDKGKWAQQILFVIYKKYPSEFTEALHRIKEDSKMDHGNWESVFEILSSISDGNKDWSLEISCSRLLFSLEHSKAEVRQAAVSGFGSSDIVKAMVLDPQKYINIKESILRRLEDDDLRVVQATLSLNALLEIIDSSHLCKIYNRLLSRCMEVLIKGSSLDMRSMARAVAISCLNASVGSGLQESDKVASMIFPLLLFLPKTWKLSLKALELATKIQWPFYSDFLSEELIEKEVKSLQKMKKIKPDIIINLNTKIVVTLAKSFMLSSGKYISWMIECCRTSDLSKTLFFLIIVQSLAFQNEENPTLLTIVQACLPMIKDTWNDLESKGSITCPFQFDFENMDKNCSCLISQSYDLCSGEVNASVVICVFWSIIKALSIISRHDAQEADRMNILQTLFVFFLTVPSKHAFKEHLHLLVTTCNMSSVKFLSIFFAEKGYPLAVQVGSLHSFANLCSSSITMKTNGVTDDHCGEVLLSLPLLLIPLGSEDQDVRLAALKCISGLHQLWMHMDVSNGKNGINSASFPIILAPAFGKLLHLITEEKELISSDKNFLPSFLASVLGFSDDKLLVPQSTDVRFDEQSKMTIIHFILSSAMKFSTYGKFMILSLFKGFGNSLVQVEGVKLLLCKLLERRQKYHFCLEKSSSKLSELDVEILCILLESCASSSHSSPMEDFFINQLSMALKVINESSEDPAIIRPCVTVLKKIRSSLYESLNKEGQENMFQVLVHLSRSDNAEIQNAAKDALLHTNVKCSTISAQIDFILSQESCSSNAIMKTKKKRPTKLQMSYPQDLLFSKSGNVLSFLFSLLDVLLLKKNIEDRFLLVESLFMLLVKVSEGGWIHQFVDDDVDENHTTTSFTRVIQQTILLILEEIVSSLSSDTGKKDQVLDKFDVKLIIEIAHSSDDVNTRNHAFSLLSSATKIIPNKVLNHIIELFTVVGEASILQCDSHSKFVLENLISTVVPCWLLRTKSSEELLKIFVDVLPQIAKHRRLSLMVYLLRTLGENRSLGSLLALLFHSLVQRVLDFSKDKMFKLPFASDEIVGEWEYVFALHLCEQYSCTIWLPSLVTLVQKLRLSSWYEGQVIELLLTLKLVLQKLDDTELSFTLGSGQDLVDLQSYLGALMEQIILSYKLINHKSTVPRGHNSVKLAVTECLHLVLKIITIKMSPSIYYSTTSQLLRNSDGDLVKKALFLLSETLKDQATTLTGHKDKTKWKNQITSLKHLDCSSLDSFNEMCLEIVKLIDGYMLGADDSLKMAALTTLEILANTFTLENNISAFATCLKCIVNFIGVDNLGLSSSCLCTTGALINALGPKALSNLPQVMHNILDRIYCVDQEQNNSQKESFLFSVLVTLEAIIDKLGYFLSPYLDDILKLLILHGDYASDSKLKLKASKVRKLVVEKVPVRLIVMPLLKMQLEAVNGGVASLSVAYEMLSEMISTFDRSCIGKYHARIFDQCLTALDVRRQNPESIQDVNLVEESVTQAIITLTMKLTEFMFRPLFLRSLEWAESEFEQIGSTKVRSLDRLISFYKLVDKLAEQHRSLFVPYFKHLLENCTHHLTGGRDVQSISQKKKKARIIGAEDVKEMIVDVSLKQWHLRAMIISSLNKCFIYDRGSLTFLDTQNFQVLLKPIVSQLTVDPPSSLEEHPDIPSTRDVDDSLVSCIGQMAVTAGNDLLWKPLNHEVLMQTRSEKVRARLLGLKVVKYLVEHLKEEYMVLLPETIPFLGELLEDVEPPVKYLAQEILKEMESLSGESLKEYL